jgi:quercetin dioxygenase-like cupin family protein
MEVKPKRPTAKGPAETFTGDVWVGAVYDGQEPHRARVRIVRFSPGARTAWHSHALGQTLYVTEGIGRAQARGGPIIEVAAGDIVYTPADEEHWHGASPDHLLAHLSITEGTGDNDMPTTGWGDHVTENEYHGQPRVAH